MPEVNLPINDAPAAFGRPRKREGKPTGVPSYVYVVGTPALSVVKIGRTTRPAARLATLRTASPVPLQILWIATGGKALEQELHRHFASRHARAEWFDFGDLDPVAEIERAAREIAGDSFVVAPVPREVPEWHWDRVRSPRRQQPPRVEVLRVPAARRRGRPPVETPDFGSGGGMYGN